MTIYKIDKKNDNGVTASYWAVGHIVVDFQQQRAEIMMFGYITADDVNLENDPAIKESIIIEGDAFNSLDTVSATAINTAMNLAFTAAGWSDIKTITYEQGK